MNSHLGVIVRILVQIRRKDKELPKFFYIDRQRTVSDHLDLFRFRSYATFTHDAHKKWYFAGSKYKLVEVGILLVLAHKFKNLPDVESVHFYIRLSVHIQAMDEHIIEVAGRKFSYRSQQICHTSVECSSGIT